jgi:serine/threonine-protein kinase
MGYRILGRIGEGGMGVVYLAESQEDRQKPVALKLLPPRLKQNEEAHGRFRREILANSFFASEHVINIFDGGETEDGSLYLAMEFFDGEELEGLLQREGRLEAERTIGFSLDVLKGLEAAHDANIIHRDVKPANVLISRDGARAKLMDFGIARILDADDFSDKIFLSVQGSVTGTPQYMSPEQASGDSDLDGRSDLYSTGVMVYQMLSGELPFFSETPLGYLNLHILEDPKPLTEAAPDVPEELAGIVMRLLVKDRDERFQTARETITAIEEALPKVQKRKSGFFGRFFGRFK